MRPFLMTEEKRERYTRQGHWGQDRLIDVFERNAARYPDREILVDSTNRVTFGDARKFVDRIALGLVQLGYARDDVLVIQLPNVVEGALARLSTYAAGVLPLSILPALGANETRHILGQSEARGIVIPWRVKERDYVQMVQGLRTELPRLEHVFVVCDAVPEGCISLREMMQRPIEREYPTDYLEDRKTGQWDVQELTTTTGSTGLPKLMERYGSLFGLAEVHGRRWQLTQDDVIGVPVPFAGGIAYNAWPPALTCPCKLAFLEAFSPEAALRFVQDERVTLLIGVPAIGEMLVRTESLERYDLSSLRAFFSAGAPMTPSLAREIEAKLGCLVIGLLGSMDFGPICSSSVDQPAELRHVSVGTLIPGTELRLVGEDDRDVPPGTEGEALVRGPYVSMGYYRNPEMTLAACDGDVEGWFRTGDLLRIDQDGNVYVVGRKKEVIKRGGVTIAPAEIENLLRVHPDVQEVAVVPMPDRVMGEKACAFVILRAGRMLSFEQMIEFLRAKNVATFKLPERLEIVQEFPMVAGAKIARARLTAMATEKLREEGKI